MTVAELIAWLNTMPPDALVVLTTDEEENCRAIGPPELHTVFTPMEPAPDAELRITSDPDWRTGEEAFGNPRPAAVFGFRG
jgi:hypothetical protein